MLPIHPLLQAANGVKVRVGLGPGEQHSQGGSAVMVSGSRHRQWRTSDARRPHLQRSIHGGGGVADVQGALDLVLGLARHHRRRLQGGQGESILWAPGRSLWHAGTMQPAFRVVICRWPPCQRTGTTQGHGLRDVLLRTLTITP